MPSEKEISLTGAQKAAILTVALGAEVAAHLYRELDEEDVETLTKEVVSLKSVDAESVRGVLEEYHQMIRVQEYVLTGGVDYAKEILQQAMEDQQAMDVIRRVEMSVKVRGFDILKEVDPSELANLVQQEHPQTIALVLTQLDPMQAAVLLSDLPEERRSDVLHRYATMERVSRDMVTEVEKALQSRIDFTLRGGQFGGVKGAAEILNLVGQTTEKKVLNSIAQRDPGLADQIKSLMFVFEDILLLDGRDIQTIVQQLEPKDLSLALKGASDEVKEKILSNMSDRASTMLLEEMDYLGAVKLREVEEAQHRILDVIKALDDQGEISIRAGVGEEVIE